MRILAILLVLCGVACADELSVMTFNIRYGTANDGENAWEHRRELVTGLIDESGMDVIGLQEALRFQIDEIRARAPRYAEIGVGRDDGLAGGEYSAILYDSARFGVAASGAFWLSDAPGSVGSTSWGNSIPRICTWARLIELASGEGFYVFNTHFDHQSQPSRERAAQQIAATIRARAFDEPVILMGDFNAGESNQAMTTLREAGLVDSFRVVHPDASAVGTFCGFDASRTSGEKIDHVFVDGFEIVDANIDRTNVEGRCPSDHFPVWARVRP